MASNNLSQYNYCWFSRCFLTFLAVSCYFLLTLHTSSCADASFGWRMGGYVIYIWKAFTRRFVLDTSESRKFFTVVKDKATVDAYGYVFADILCLCLSCSARWVWCIVWIVYMHISVGFCVARSDWVGNAKALIWGTGNGYRLPRFFISTCNHLQTCWIRGVYRRQDL